VLLPCTIKTLKSTIVTLLSKKRYSNYLITWSLVSFNEVCSLDIFRFLLPEDVKHPVTSSWKMCSTGLSPAQSHLILLEGLTGLNSFSYEIMLLFKVEFYTAVWFACMVSCCGIGEHAKLTLKLKCFVNHTEQIKLCSAVLQRTM
jgi:hypothetical protein